MLRKIDRGIIRSGSYWSNKSAEDHLKMLSDLDEKTIEAGAQALANDVWHPPQRLESLPGHDVNKFRRQARLVLEAALSTRDGDIPERETWWLIERTGTGLYTTSSGCYPGWSPDPWRACRYETARAADNARLLIASDNLRDSSAVTEHVFINKMPGSSAPSAQSGDGK